MSGTSAVSYNPNSYDQFVANLQRADAANWRNHIASNSFPETQIGQCLDINDKGEDGIYARPSSKPRDYFESDLIPSNQRTSLAKLLFDTWGFKNSALHALQKGDEEALDQIFALFGAKFLKTAGLEVKIKGYEKLDPNKTYLFAPMHSSFGDIPLLFFVLQQWRTGYTAKSSLATKWYYKLVFGEVLAASERFPLVDRSSKDKLTALTNRLLDVYLPDENRVSVITFPTGTRVDHAIQNGQRVDGDIFKKREDPFGLGLFVAALKLAQLGRPIEIVPITVNGMGAAWGKGKDIKPGLIEVVIGEPFDSSFALDAANIDEAAAPLKAKIAQQWRDNYTGHLTPPNSHRTRPANKEKNGDSALAVPRTAPLKQFLGQFVPSGPSLGSSLYAPRKLMK